MRLHEIRHIDRPPDQVFAFTADFANAEKWDPGVASSRRMDEGPPGVGARYEVMVAFGSSEIPMVYEITEWDQDARVVLVGKGDTMEAVDEIRFQPGNGGTLVDYTAELTFTNWFRFVVPLMSPALRRVGEKALDGLVTTLER
ncbi:MAG TPA: SRPBCC family protein [Acidimicrobiia bacterium]|nr:SRPBCC family protein [Acidimicrobiia bacterium]